MSRRAPLIFVTAWAITFGVFEIGLAFGLPLSGQRRLLLAAFGVIMLSHPGARAVALLALVAAFAFVTGVMQIGFALELRRIVSDSDRRLRPQPAAKPLAHA